jgi:hypothetical protein
MAEDLRTLCIDQSTLLIAADQPMSSVDSVRELTKDELALIAGGAGRHHPGFNLDEVNKSAVTWGAGTAAGMGALGAVLGSEVPVVGTAAGFGVGAAAGFVTGAISGGVADAASQLWNMI